jgi:peptidyl-prolyl cis-trans isomerase SurA
LDAEVNKRTSGNSRAVEYTLRQVTVVVAPNAAPGVVQQRAGVVQTLRSRFENCTTGPELINATTDAAIREPIRRSSSDLGAEFRRVLDSTQVGRLTPPSRTSQGFEMIALCGKSEMRSDNQVMRNQVRDELTQTELRRISQTYLQQIRRQAVIEYPRGRP